MKNAVFCYVTPFGTCKRGSFGGTYRLHLLGDKNGRAWNNIISIYEPKHAQKKYLITEAINFSEMSVLTRVTRRNIPEDGIL
jgi:hypothetical protein